MLRFAARCRPVDGGRQSNFPIALSPLRSSLFDLPKGGGPLGSESGGHLTVGAKNLLPLLWNINNPPLPYFIDGQTFFLFLEFRTERQNVRQNRAGGHVAVGAVGAKNLSPLRYISESSLNEMLVEGKRFQNISLFHNHKRNAVGKGIGFVLAGCKVLPSLAK